MSPRDRRAAGSAFRRAGRAVVLLVALTTSVSEAHGQNPSGLDRSIVLLLDGSYSMSLRPERSGERRIDVALRWANELLRRATADEEWAVLVTDGREGARIVRPFQPAGAGGPGKRLSVAPDGATPLGAGLERAARYLREEGAGTERRIVLISDGLATEPEAYRLPDPAWFRERSVTVTAVLVRVPAVAERQAELEQFVAGTGGRLFDAQGAAAGGGPAELVASIRLPDRGSAAAGTRPRGVAYREAAVPSGAPGRQAVRAWAATGLPGRAVARVSAGGGGPGGPPAAGAAVLAAGRNASPSFRPVWLALPLVALSVWRLARRMLAVARSLRTPRVSIGWRRILRLDLRTSGGSRPVVLRTLPARIGSSAAADLRLELTRGAPPLPDFEIRPTREGAEFASPSPLNVNGVSRRHKLLRDGDSVAYGAHRVVFRDVSSERVVTRRPPVAVGLPWELGLLAACLLAGTLFRERLSTPVDLAAALASGRNRAGVAREGQAGAEDGPGDAGEAGAGLSLSATARPSAGARSRSRGMLSAPPTPVAPAASPAAPEAPLFAPRAAARRPEAVTVWAPGESIAWSRADALLVHAHPDDESIDFGVLASRLSAAGKRVVAVLMTDGEAGLDQYPDRETGGPYAARDLWPEELAAIRPLEARRALAELGATGYVRLGLRNHPYATSRQVLPLGAVMASWGGEESVVGRLVDIIEGFRPALVASPDSAHGGAHEHFEHAAAGYAVREALRRVRSRGVHSVSVHARSVDPRFCDAYDDVQALDALERLAPSGESPRERQARALRQHRTQRDATVVALESLTSQRWEYYVTTFWSEPTTLDRFLRTW